MNAIAKTKDRKRAARKDAKKAPANRFKEDVHPNVTPDGNYHYTECGLDKVYLENGFEVLPDGEGGFGVAIHNVTKLHSAIAHDIVNQGSKMTGDEFRFLRTLMDCSQSSIAQLMHTDAQSVARWEKGKNYNPVADTMLRTLYMLFVDQDVDIRDTLERLADIDDVDQHIRLYKARRGNWKADFAIAA